MRGRLFLVMLGPADECRACDLRDAGWYVDAEYEDGGQAYRVIRQEPPDAVLVDLGRRPSHGREVVRALRGAKVTRDLPLVLIGGTPAAVDEVLALASDALVTDWDGLPAVLDRFGQGEVGA